MKCPACNCEEIVADLFPSFTGELINSCQRCNGIFGTISRVLFNAIFQDGELFESEDGETHYFDFIIKGDPARRVHGWAEFGGRIVQYG